MKTQNSKTEIRSCFNGEDFSVWYKYITLAFVFAFVSGCSMWDDLESSLWPSLSDDEEQVVQSEDGEISEDYPALPEEQEFVDASPPPSLESEPRDDYSPQVESSIAPDASGTFVGGKTASLRNDLTNLKAALNGHSSELRDLRTLAIEHTQNYHGLVAAIYSRLQVGTTPGNPVLVHQWNESQRALELLGNDIANMTSLSNTVTADSAMIGYLLESVSSTYGLSGAIEEDWRNLAILEDDVSKNVIIAERLLGELSDDIQRQNEYIYRQRRELSTVALAIKNGEMYGEHLANLAFKKTEFSQPDYSSSIPSPESKTPLVNIAFADEGTVDYEQDLYKALSTALEKKSNVVFDVVAMSPISGSSATDTLSASKVRKRAEDVFRTMVQMGMPAGKITLSSKKSGDIDGNQVRVYVR